MSMARLLIVEDDRITALDLQRTVTKRGHTVVACVASAAEAMAAVQAYRPDAVLLDVGLRGPQDGLGVGVDIQTLWSTPVIYLSGSTPRQLGLPEFPEALWCYVPKPIDWDRLCDILARLFPSMALRQSTPELNGGNIAYGIRRTPQELREELRQLRQSERTVHTSGQRL
jgi:DNA-binding NtrC family response regulator